MTKEKSTLPEKIKKNLKRKVLLDNDDNIDLPCMDGTDAYSQTKPDEPKRSPFPIILLNWH